jgi:hypothetical protein
MGESWWDHTDAVDWSPSRSVSAAEVFHPELRATIADAVARAALFHTLGRQQPNTVHDVTPDGVRVETLQSVRKGRPPQRVPAWMIQVAWDWLQAHGQLTQTYLLADDGLNVKRSAFVCALLARLHGAPRCAGAKPARLGGTRSRRCAGHDVGQADVLVELDEHTFARGGQCLLECRRQRAGRRRLGRVIVAGCAALVRLAGAVAVQRFTEPARAADGSGSSGGPMISR